jgi:hypothetical protein
MNSSNNSSVSPMPTIDEEVNNEQGTPAQQLFFRQLHAMITNESSNGCVKWLSDNKGFQICNRDSFSDKILPRYFGKAKYSSFTRRLKRWGFRRVSKGADSGAYYHDTFHKDMDFEAYEDEEGDISECSPSEQSLPLKKRMAWSPVPGNNLKSVSSNSNGMCSGNADVRVMPEIMREINRSKRFEREEYNPNVKKAKLGQSAICNGGMASFNYSAMNRPFMPDVKIGKDDCGFAGFRSTSVQDYSEDRVAHQNHLARLKRRVFEQNQGIDFSLGCSQTRNAHGNSLDFLNPARRDLSQLSTEILQREIAVRSFNEDNRCASGQQMQGLPCIVNSSQMRRQVMVNVSNPSMNFHLYNNDHGRTNEYCSRVLGAVKESAGHMDRSNFGSLNANTSINEEKGHYRLDSVNIPIPGVKDMEEPTKRPFNRAAA